MLIQQQWAHCYYTEDLVNIDPAIATFTLQNHLNQIQEWTKIWKIKINEAKSTQVNFSLRIEQCLAYSLITYKYLHLQAQNT
jgi:hypothetical protein